MGEDRYNEMLMDTVCFAGSSENICQLCGARRMKKLKWILPMGLLILAIAGVWFYRHYVSAACAIRRIYGEEDRRRSFSILLKRNNIQDMPKDFDLWSKETSIDCFEAVDSNEVWYGLVCVTYSVGGRGDRSFSVIFDKSGKCVFKSIDLFGFINGGLLDINDDGKIEKIITYFSDDLEEEPKENYEKLRVYRIDLDRNELLLDVNFNIYPFMNAVDFFGVDVDHIEKVISLRKIEHPAENVKFIWSKEEKKFMAIGPKANDWKLIYPAE